MCGGTPAEAEATIRARGVRPWRSTASALATTIAEAPSDSGEALPAVTTPSALKAGLSLASASALASARGTSSSVDLALAGLDGHEVERQPLAVLRRSAAGSAGPRRRSPRG